MPSPSAPEEIVDYYERRYDEAGRLSRGLGRLEFARTCSLIERALPTSTGRVYDIGGGPGRYSEWLSSLGHHCALLDASPKHVAQARDLCAHRAGFSAVVGDARALPWPDDSAPVVLLLGPLYHLCDEAERLAALGEARRVCAPGGVVIAAAISHLASTLVGLPEGWWDDADYRAMCARELTEGQHRVPERWPSLFTRAFFHHPDRLEAECRSAGFTDVTLYGVEGPGWMTDDLDTDWEDESVRQALLDLAALVERDRSAMAISPHLLAVCRV